LTVGNWGVDQGGGGLLLDDGDVTLLVWVGVCGHCVWVRVEFYCISCGDLTIAHIRALPTIHLITVLVHHKGNTFSTTVLGVHPATRQAVNGQSKGCLKSISQSGDFLVIPDLSLLVLPLG
jgi:hypothetical protein